MQRSQRPELVIPYWQQLGSGLYVPTSIADRVQLVEDAAELPPELLQAPAPVAILERRPSSADQVVVRPSEDDLGLTQPTSLPQLIDYVRHVPFEPAMIAVCRLQAMLWHISRSGQDQLALAREFFGESELIERFRVFLGRHENAILFSEQEFFVVQRLLVEHAEPRTLDDGMTEADFRWLRAALIGARSVVDETHANLERATASEEEILAYLVQNGAYYHRPNLLHSYARAYALFAERARATATDSSACPVDEWVHDDYPLTLEEQFATGFGLQAVSKALDKDRPAAERSLVDLEQAFGPTALHGRETDIAQMLAAPRDWYAARFAERGNALRTIVWNTTPFLQRPFIEFSDGRLGLISPRTIATWLGDGFYYRLLECAQRRQEERRTGRENIVERYTSYVGRLLEGWALDAARSAYGTDRPAGGGRIYGEQPYGNGRATPDVVIDLGLDLVLIEVRSGYLREETRISGDPREFATDLERVLFRKIRQLGDRIADLVAGSAQIPEVDMALVERIWPVVVTANITQTEALYDWIGRELNAPLRQARVQNILVLDPEDLEMLLGMVESGASLTDILASRQAGPFAKLELARWANEDRSSPGTPRPSFAEERWERVTRSLHNVLQLPVTSRDGT